LQTTKEKAVETGKGNKFHSSSITATRILYPQKEIQNASKKDVQNI